MKILFITANRVGDAVLTTGLLDWLIKQYPQASFTIACGPYCADIFRAVPRLERLIIMKKKKYNGHWLDLWRACAGVKWDLIVDLRNSIVSRLLRAKRRAIHGKGSGAHKIVDNSAVLKLDPPPDPHIWIAVEALAEAKRLMPTNIPVLALGPAANWPLKQWPVRHFIDLVKNLTAPDGALEGAYVMVIADRHEQEQVAPLLEAIPEARRIVITSHNLQIVAACLKYARLYVGNDSGLMHMAAALGTPTLGLFGPGFPPIYRPWGEKCAYITTPETREELMVRAPKIVTKNDTLMDTLTPERVTQAAEDLLARTA